MTADEIIDEVLRREGGWRDQVTRPDGSIDPATNLGITLPTLGAWRHTLQLPESELRALTPEEARAIYTEVYIGRPGFTAENIPFEPLRAQLIDFGVNSGPERAIRWLQRVLHVPVTGTLDALTRRTLLELRAAQVGDYLYDLLPLVNDALVAARSYMIRRAVASGKIRKEDSEGLQRRAMEFFLAKP